MIRWCTIYIPSKFAKVPLYNISGPADLIASGIFRKSLGTTTKAYLKISPKVKEEKVVKKTHLRIKNSRGKFSFGVLIFDVKRKDSHELLICLNSSTFKKKTEAKLRHFCFIFVIIYFT